MRTTNPAVALFDRHRMKGHAKKGGMRALRTPPFDGLSYAPIEAYRPTQTGSRFSTNAFGPSMPSSVFSRNRYAASL